MSGPEASVVISTKDRKEDLRECLKSVLSQTAAIEVIVIDDGSSDGTSEMVRDEFPRVRLDRQEKSLGLIAERNRGADLAAGPIIVSIDDDAVFTSPKTIEQTLAEFRHPRVGAVAIPYVDVKISPEVKQQAPDTAHVWVSEQYRGTAHALRKDLFIKLGRYRAFLGRQGEENDYSIRLLDAGYVPILGRADPIQHMESPKRNKAHIYRYTARNSILHGWWNVPMPEWLFYTAGTKVVQLVDGVRHARFGPRLHGLWQGFLAIPCQARERKPVSRGAYRLSRTLRKRGPMRLEEVEKLLGPMRFE